VAEVDIAAYLDRIAAPAGEHPSVAGLFAVHRAHVERVPYETVEIQLGRPTTVDPVESARRIVEGRQGGYCYHLNGALSLLLAGLGYNVRWHRGGVQPRTSPEPVGATANHLALTVHALPSAGNPGGVWFVDAGLGDALHEPLPLVAGGYQQGPFRFRLEPSTVEPGGWRFEHDPRGGFTGMDFRMATATVADFADRHVELSTSPESGFVRTFTAARRYAGGAEALRGRTLTIVDGAGTSQRVMDGPDEWYAVLARRFGLTLPGLDPAGRARLWRRIRLAHEAWLASGEAG
jgi:arylamine N-acetyltransferase